MTFSINTNAAAMAALQTLRQTNADLTATQNAVSTGKKVSSASDDPAIYAIAQKMNTQISGLSAVSNGLSTGAQVISTSSNALSSISNSLKNIQGLVSQGQSQSIDPSVINASIANELKNIDSYAQSATFSGVNLIAGSTGGAITSNQLSLVTDVAGTSVLSIGGKTTSTSTAMNATSAGLGLANLTTSSQGVSFTGIKTTDLASAVISLQNSVATGSSAKPAESWTFTLASTDAGKVDTVTTDSVGNATSVSHAVTIVPASGQSAQDAIVAAMKAAGFSASFSQDSTAGSVDLNIAGNDVHYDSTKTTVTTGGATPGAAGTATAWTGSSAAIATVQAAVDKLTGMTTTLGAATTQVTGLQSYTSTLSSALTAGAGALTDADLSEESAKLTSLQTKQQLAIQSLSMANSQSQSILSLFR